MEPDQPPSEQELVEAVTTLRAAYVPYAHLERTKGRIKRLLLRNNAASEGAVYALIGPTRSGKSHLLRNLEDEYAREVTPNIMPNGDVAVRIPMLTVKVPDASKKSLALAIYKALTNLDPEVTLGRKFNAERVKDEIVRIARECDLRLLVLDEAHQGIDNKSDREASEVAVFVEDLANEGRFSLLVAGTENALRLIRSNPELAARSHKTLRLKPFQRTLRDLEVWYEVLDSLDLYLADKVFGGRSGLSEPRMAEALMTAACGLIGHAATLIEIAATEALDDMLEGEPQPGIRWRHLENAFAEAAGRGTCKSFCTSVYAAIWRQPLANR